MAVVQIWAKTNDQNESDANVLLELRYSGGDMSEEVLDANSDDVIEAVEAHAADLALGPTVGINTHECAIKLRFDVVAKNDAEVHRKIAKVIAVIEKHTGWRRGPGRL